MKIILASLLLAGSIANAQILKQPFIGSGITTAWSNGAHSVVATAGFALVVPVSKKFFIRPVISAGEVVPLSTAKSFPVFQAGCLVGYRLTKKFSALSGFAETIQLPQAGPVYLPTALISTATRLHGRWGIFTPITINARGYGASLQLGYTW